MSRKFGLSIRGSVLGMLGIPECHSANVLSGFVDLILTLYLSY